MTVAQMQRRQSTRRRALIGLAVLLLIVGAWMHFNSVAGATGMPTDAMDWDADGSVSGTEILQAYFAVSVAEQKEGSRTCSTYYWRADRKSIRVDCRTEFQSGGPDAKP